MSSLSLEVLRDLSRERGGSLGWGPFGDAVGVDGETLRAFVKTPTRGLQPATKLALERYFSPSSIPPDVALEVRDALAKAREAVALLERLASRAIDDDTTITRFGTAHALTPATDTQSSRPDTAPTAPRTGARRKGERSG